MSPTEEAWPVQAAADALQRARNAIAEAGAGAALLAAPGSVAWATGHVVTPALAFPSHDGRLERPTLAVVGPAGAVTLGTAPAPLVGRGVAYSAGSRYEELPESLDSVGWSGGRILLEPDHVPAGALQALQALGSPPDVRPIGSLLADLREAKSPWELEGIREACAVVDAAHEAIRSAIAAGASELDLYAVAVGAMNAEAGGQVLAGGELQYGERAGRRIFTAEPTSIRLTPGDVAISDIYARHPNGWWSDSCSTIVCGSPSPPQADALKRVREALYAGAEALRPGVRAGDVFSAVEARAGEQPGHAGHGIGRDHFEGPVIGRDVQARIPEGAVVALEPIRFVGGQAVKLEWVFRVTADGGEPLTSFPLEL
jgi:Xaa-Pro aminopeptidase